MAPSEPLDAGHFGGIVRAGRTVLESAPGCVVTLWAAARGTARSSVVATLDRPDGRVLMVGVWGMWWWGRGRGRGGDLIDTDCYSERTVKPARTVCLPLAHREAQYRSRVPSTLASTLLNMVAAFKLSHSDG